MQTTICDQCDQRIGETSARFHVERVEPIQGFDMGTRPIDVDFCSLACISAWVTVALAYRAARV